MMPRHCEGSSPDTSSVSPACRAQSSAEQHRAEQAPKEGQQKKNDTTVDSRTINQKRKGTTETTSGRGCLKGAGGEMVAIGRQGTAERFAWETMPC